MTLPDKDLLLITAMGILLLVLMVVFFVLFVMQYRRRQLQFHGEKLALEKEYNEELLRIQLELSERTMQNISEEIHDNIGQSLTVAKLHIHDMTSDNFQERGQTIKEIITRTLMELRNLSRTLNGEFILKEGIRQSVARELEWIQSGGSIQCNLTGSIPYHCLDPTGEIIVFRCIQEALSNAIKHAEAGRIDVDMTHRSGRLRITIADNGIGLPREKNIQKGLGMENMKKRIALLNGRVDLISAPQEGTTVRIDLPC